MEVFPCSFRSIREVDRASQLRRQGASKLPCSASNSLARASITAVSLKKKAVFRELGIALQEERLVGLLRGGAVRLTRTFLRLADVELC